MAAAMVLALFSGIGYAWSVFQTPIIDYFMWNLKSVAITYTVQILVSTIAPVFLGKFQAQLGVKNYLRLGILVYALGLFATRFTSSLIYLYLVFGIVVGIGIGMLYPCLMAYGSSLLPEKTGLASGLIAGAYGCGAVIWAPFATFLMDRFSVMVVYMILAALFFIVMMPVTFFIENVPPEFLKAMKPAEKKSTGDTGVRDYTWQEMLKSYRYYLLLLVLTLGASSGLMITGHASGIIQESLGASPETAALMVGFLSISNTLGRLILGPISDKVGRYNTILFQFVVIGLSMVVLALAQGALFIVALMLIGACYGGFTSMISPVCADNFGFKNLAVNYTFLYVAYGLAGVIGPQLAAQIKTGTGGYHLAFLVVAGMSALGLVLVLVLKLNSKKRKAGYYEAKANNT